MDMRRILIVATFALATISCTKDNTSNNKRPDPVVPVSEFEALKQQVSELKAQFDAMKPGEQAEGVSVEEFRALKEENEALKAQVENLSSVFFEVDGLRFDLNGEIISTPKKPASQTINQQEYRWGMHTSTRSYDSEGRLLETYDEYSQIGLGYFTPPFYWQKVTYEYNGKTCKTTTQTNNQPVAGQYEETITETTYW